MMRCVIPALSTCPLWLDPAWAESRSCCSWSRSASNCRTLSRSCCISSAMTGFTGTPAAASNCVPRHANCCLDKLLNVQNKLLSDQKTIIHYTLLSLAIKSLFAFVSRKSCQQRQLIITECKLRFTFKLQEFLTIKTQRQ